MSAVVGLAKSTALAMSAVLVLSAGGPPLAAAKPQYLDDDFYFVNSTKLPMVLASYVTGDPYPEYVRPANQIGPGEKFTIGVRAQSLDSTIKINFDLLDSTGKHIPGAMVELWSMGLIAREPGMQSFNIACWPGKDRSCTPRGWGKGQITATLTG